MLNISDNKHIDTQLDFNVSKQLKDLNKTTNRLITLVAILAFITLFLPWTQNISGKGAVTTLKPNQRPQSIQCHLRSN
jgi:hypothetical protein